MVLVSLGDAALNLAGVRQRRSDSGSGGGGDIIFRIGKEETSIYELRTKRLCDPRNESRDSSNLDEKMLLFKACKRRNDPNAK